VLVITDPDRAWLRPLAKSSPRLAIARTCWCCRLGPLHPERINMVFDQTIVDRGGSTEGWENYRKFLLEKYPARKPEENFQRRPPGHLALAFGALAAANEGVDCTPMEGFDPAAVDALLGLREQGLKSVVMLPLGYRDSSNDWLVKLAKSRRPKEELFTFVG
jgi:nitroreductase